MTHAIASVLAFAAGIMWRCARRAHAELVQLDDQEVADLLLAHNGLGLATVSYSQLIARYMGRLGTTTRWNPDVLYGHIGSTRWFL